MCYNSSWNNERNDKKMSKNKKTKNKNQRKYDRGQVFVKITAGILALLMVVGVLATLGFALLR
jgi:hypothetical protein